MNDTASQPDYTELGQAAADVAAAEIHLEFGMPKTDLEHIAMLKLAFHRGRMHTASLFRRPEAAV